MRRILLTALLLALLHFGPVVPTAWADPGDLDPSFGDNGAAIIDLGDGGTRILQAAVQPDGKVVAICQQSNPNDVAHPATWLVRLTSTGQTDPSFGDDGRVLVQWADPQTRPVWVTRATPLMIQPVTGRILFFYQNFGPSSLGFELAAYTSGGMLDTSFGNGGFLSAPPATSGSTYHIRGISMGADGSFVAAGAFEANRGDAAVLRFTPAGQLSADFATDGVWTMDIAHQSADWAQAAVTDHQGRILVCGTVESTKFLLRLLPHGASDPDFGDAGIVAPTQVGFRLAELLPSGKLLTYDQGVSRLNSDGSLDSAFRQIQGEPTSGAGLQWTRLSDESIVVTGTIDSGYPSFSDFSVSRYTPSGLADESFAPGGTKVIDFGAADDSPTCAVRPTGEILIAGATGSTARSTTPVAGLSGAPATQNGIVIQLVGGKRALPAKPVLARLSRTSGRRNVAVTLTGKNFGSKRGTSYVRFGTKKATKYLSWGKTRVKCRVPAKAKYGRLKVVVVTAGGTSNARAFKVKR